MTSPQQAVFCAPAAPYVFVSVSIEPAADEGLILRDYDGEMLCEVYPAEDLDRWCDR